MRDRRQRPEIERVSFEGFVRSARLGRLLRQDQAVAGEDAEAQARSQAALPDATRYWVSVRR
jgi:hypothetical protein